MIIQKIQKSDIFGHSFDKISINEQENNLYDNVNKIYQLLFSFYPHKKPSFDISDRDFNIIKSFTNEKSFEKAVDVCLQLLSKYKVSDSSIVELQDDDEEESGRVNVTEDSKILVGLVNLFAECRVPHHIKPGFLIIMVRHCFYEM